MKQILVLRSGKSLAQTALTVLLFGASTVFGAVNNCPQITSSQGGTTVPGPSGGTPDNTLTAVNAINGAGLGCTAVDLTFNNFGVTNSTGNVSTASSTYFYESPTGTFNPTVSQTVVTMATVRGTVDDTTNNFFALHNATTTDTISFTADASTLLVHGLTLIVTNAAITGSITIVVDVCRGGTGTGAIVTAGACTTAGGTFVTSSPTIVSNAGTQTFAIAGITSTAHLDITSVITINGGSGSGNNSDFLTFGYQLDETTPEPSSFVLLSTALAGVGFLRYRATKHRKNL